MAKLLPPVSKGGSLAKISKSTTGGMSSPLAGGFLNTKKKVITLDTLFKDRVDSCLLYTSPSPRDATLSRMPSSA